MKQQQILPLLSNVSILVVFSKNQMIKGSGVVNDRVPAYLHNRPALDHF